MEVRRFGIQRSLAACERIFEIMDTVPEREGKDENERVLGRLLRKEHIRNFIRKIGCIGTFTMNSLPISVR